MPARWPGTGRHSACRRIGYRAGEARALEGMAECLRDTEPAAAGRHWQEALRLFQELDHPDRYEVERRLAELPAGPEPGGAVGHNLTGSGHRV